MNKIGTQLWIGNEDRPALNESLIQPVKNNLRGLGVKGQGGLWTSTYLGEKCGSGWVEWSVGNEFGVPADDIWRGYVLKPKKDLRIYTINSLEEMHILFDKYGYQLYPDIKELKMEGINFEEMSKDYDALHLTEYGEGVTRHGFSFFRDITSGLKPEWKAKKMRNFYGWDCESTFHFRWNFEKIKPIELKIERVVYE